MPGFLQTTFLIARLHLFHVLRTRRTWIGLALLAVPLAVAQLVFSAEKNVPVDAVVTHLGWFLLLQVMTPILALISGSAVISEERENRTITYLFTRPIPRATLLLGRYLATLVWITVGLAAAGAALVLLARQHALGLPDADALSAGVAGPLLRTLVIGGAVYTALFAALGAVTKYPMIVGAAYTFVIEGFLANLPGSLREMTVQYWLRTYLLDTGSSAWHLPEFVGGDADAQAALTRLALILVLSLVGGSWVVSRREFVLPA